MTVKNEEAEKSLAVTSDNSQVAAINTNPLAALAGEHTDDQFGAGDRLVPWLKIVQTTSGVKKRTNEAYVEGAEVGMIYDTLTREMHDEVLISVVKFDGVHYAEFEPNGGKIVKQWFKDSSRYEASEWKNPDKPVGKKITPDGNEIAPSSVFYVLILDPATGFATPAIWSLGGTNQKSARRVNSLAKQPIAHDGVFIADPAMYSRTFKLTTRVVAMGESENDVGLWTAEPAGLITDGKFGSQWLDMAKAMRKEADAGKLQPAQPLDEADPDDGDSEARRDAEAYEASRRASQKASRVTDVEDTSKVPF